MLQNLHLTVAVENSASKSNSHLLAQHGLSILMSLDLGGGEGMKLLWDTGASSEVMLHNAAALNIDLDAIDLICLSHGHYDHTGGLMGVLAQRKSRGRERLGVLCHPDVFAAKLKARPGLKFIGLPFTETQVEAEGGIWMQCRGPVPIAPGLTTTGEIPRREAFEAVEGFWTIREDRYCPDSIPDDQALAADIPGKGLVVITGCAHSGIINTIKHALEITGAEKLHAVIGGFHLMGADDCRIEATVQALKKFHPAAVCPGHCTGEKAVSRLREAFGDRCKPMAVGDQTQF
ncbi:MAG TPA: MBL fold metallo-hydrolase [Methanothrix sp.]|nr:MBL fold metallo-hydrolase [Methanothrix sp.]HPT18477.1 MBL fold metallo-hydrolase [Methanothrix sp.]